MLKTINMCYSKKYNDLDKIKAIAKHLYESHADENHILHIKTPLKMSTDFHRLSMHVLYNTLHHQKYKNEDTQIFKRQNEQPVSMV